MKVLFLDFDGVLNSNRWVSNREEITEYHKEKELSNDLWHKWQFDPETIDILNDIVEKTDCKIVISSTLRKNRTVTKLQELLSMVGFKYPDNIIDKTPVFFFKAVPEYQKFIPSAPRGSEIRFWLERNKDRYSIESYCIIDDDFDMLLKQKDNFVQTNFMLGLTIDDSKKVIQILEKKSKYY